MRKGFLLFLVILPESWGTRDTRIALESPALPQYILFPLKIKVVTVDPLRLTSKFV